MNSLQENSDATIWTEGKTDWKHLKKALKKLNLKLNVDFYEYEDKDMGSTVLLSKCKTFADTPHKTPIVCIFDGDEKNIIKEVEEPDKGYKNWGNNVFSFSIPKPSHRQGYENISIEMYYTNDELKTEDSNGRRLFLTSEFYASGTYKKDNTIHIGHKGHVKDITEEKKAKIVDSEVYQGEKNIALSKDNFANYIYDNVEPFSMFNCEEFRKVFDIIQKIIQITSHKINIYFPEPEQFLNNLPEVSVPQQCSELLENILDIMKIALQLFIITTIRYYENIIIEEPAKYRKKVRPIKKILTENFRDPSLLTIRSLAEKCFYLTDEEAPEQLLSMKKCLETGFTLGAIAEILNDLQKIFPDATDEQVIRLPQTGSSLLKHVIPGFSDYEPQIPFLAKKIDNGNLNIDIGRWKQAFKAIIEFITPILSSSHIFTFKELNQADTISGYYLANITTYKNQQKETRQDVIDFKEFEDWQDCISTLVIEGNDQSPISIDLSPFLIIKNDCLYFYRRTRAIGYEYHSVFNRQVTIKETQKKFNHAVFKTGSQQVSFWMDVLPTINPANKIKANIPIEGLEGFVGRKKQIKDIIEEIIEIPNQNGIVYGPGGVGKTALMLEISRHLLEEKNLNRIIFDNIIWVSAKSTYYDYTHGIMEKKEQQIESLDNIFSVLLYFFEYEDIDEYAFEDKKEFVLELLEENRILLFLDNFETIPDEETKKIIKFFDIDVKKHLRKKPDFFKVIITSRKLIPSSFHQMELKGLDSDESKQLMQTLLFQKYKHASSFPTDEQQEKLHEAAHGIPIVIKHCFGQYFEFHIPIEAVLYDLSTTSIEVIKFSFAEIFKLLKNNMYQLEIIILLEIINTPLLIRQIADILGRTEFEIQKKLPTLLDFQCIKRVNQRTEEKYVINEEIRFFTKGLTQESHSITEEIRQKMICNFSIDKQMDYTSEELGLVGLFSKYLLEREDLKAEDFIKEQLNKKPLSILLNFHYAKYLKERKRKIDDAISRLENIRQIANNHPSILRLLVSCYTSLDIPNYTGASLYVGELEKVAQESDDLKKEIGEFYVKWSTSIKMNRELDPNSELLRKQKYKEHAENGINILHAIENKTHEVYYLLAQGYFNKWDYDSAFDMINKAITIIKHDPLYYSSYDHLRNRILRTQEYYRNVRD